MEEKREKIRKKEEEEGRVAFAPRESYRFVMRLRIYLSRFLFARRSRREGEREREIYERGF